MDGRPFRRRRADLSARKCWVYWHGWGGRTNEVCSGFSSVSAVWWWDVFQKDPAVIFIQAGMAALVIVSTRPKAMSTNIPCSSAILCQFMLYVPFVTKVSPDKMMEMYGLTHVVIYITKRKYITANFPALLNQWYILNLQMLQLITMPQEWRWTRTRGRSSQTQFFSFVHHQRVLKSTILDVGPVAFIFRKISNVASA